MFAQIGNTFAQVPEDINDDVSSILYSIINNKLTTIYNFDDKNITYVIPFKNNLNVLNTESNPIFFTQLQLQINDKKMNYIPLKTTDNFTYSIINKDEDILNLNTDIFRYSYDVLRFLKKTYTDCGFLFVKTTKKNVELIFTQEVENNNVYIPFVSLIELNKLQTYLVNSQNFNRNKEDTRASAPIKTSTLLYNAQGELVRMNDENESLKFNKRELILDSCDDYILTDEHKISLDGIKIGFYGIDKESISKFNDIINKKRNIYDIHDFHDIHINKSECEICRYEQLRENFNNVAKLIESEPVTDPENNEIELPDDYLESIKSETDFNANSTKIKQYFATRLSKSEYTSFVDRSFHYNYSSFLKFQYIYNKLRNKNKKEEYNKPIEFDFDVNEYLKTKYNIPKPEETLGKMEKICSMIKNMIGKETNNFVYFNIKDIEIKPEDIKL